MVRAPRGQVPLALKKILQPKDCTVNTTPGYVTVQSFGCFTF
jgi:hypothetical protein